MIQTDLNKGKACAGKLRAVWCYVDVMFKGTEAQEVGLMYIQELGFCPVKTGKAV